MARWSMLTTISLLKFRCASFLHIIILYNVWWMLSFDNVKHVREEGIFDCKFYC